MRLFALLLLLPGLALAAPADAPVTHAELDGLIAQFLKTHPEAVVDSLLAMQKKEEDVAKVKSDKAVKANSGEFQPGKDTPQAGDTVDPEVTLTEFTDYNCGVCRQMFHVVDKVVQNKELKVRVLFKEFPIFGEESEMLARAALAVHRVAPDKYYAFHSALMTLPGHNDPATVDQLLASMDIDAGKVKALADSKEIRAVIDRNHALGKKLGIKGTPTLVVGDEMIPSAMPEEDLIERIEFQRKKAQKQ